MLESLWRLANSLLAFGLAIGLLPVIVWVAIQTKRTSDGPILFRQRRHSKNGVHYSLLKFRTMQIDEESRVSPLGGRDRRVTFFGHTVRTLRLDHLPILLNVMRGDLTFWDILMRKDRFGFSKDDKQS